MKPGSSILIVSSFLLAACGTPVTVATPAPGPAPAPATTAAPSRPNSAPATSPAASSKPSNVAPPVRLPEAPKDWQLLDETTDHVPGIGAKRAMAELLANRAPRRTVIVAVIDGGVDTSHADLRANLWTNPKEVPGNGKDDDGNGYVDDVHGWDFIGGSNGEDIHFDTFEVTREYARCHGKAAASGAPPITDTAQCATIDSAFKAKRGESEQLVDNYRQAAAVMHEIVPQLERAIGDSLTLAKVRAFRPSDPQLARAQAIYVQLVSQGATLKALDDGLKSIEGQLKYGLNPDYDPRSTVGDHYTDTSERHYGNPDVTGPDASHGTHVSGIIAAVRGNGLGVDGIAPAVKIMAIRAVPDGDERDKDIANAIRYAVDNGAQIISMSFGKPFSPYKSAVDDAVRYADQKGVLMVHAAGNDGADIGTAPNFPSPAYLDGSRPRLWIEVGASSWKGGDSLAASFSNYNQRDVSVFAPGVDVYSTVPGNSYQRESGTSMAAPVVSGVAALIMSYFPDLTAAQVKDVIIESASRYPDQRVLKPGGNGERVPFGSLSATGGIVNAYNAIKLLQQREAGSTP